MKASYRRHILLTLLLITLALRVQPADALNILLVNDDGLSPNVRAQYDALRAAGHDVLVSIPCANQSGKGAAISLFTPLAPLTLACRGNAVPVGAPGVGDIRGKPDFHYVNGTPVMATLYGLDVLPPSRWGRPPDLVLSGPNEGQNAGPIVNSSGTVSNAQYAANVGVSSIAVSADANTSADNTLSAEAAQLSMKLIAALEDPGHPGALLPKGVALNVNYPKFTVGQSARLQWALTRHGTYSSIKLGFAPDLSKDPLAQAMGSNAPYPGLVLSPNPVPPTRQQRDEAVVSAAGKITVTVMQAGFDADGPTRRRLGNVLRNLFRPKHQRPTAAACNEHDAANIGGRDRRRDRESARNQLQLALHMVVSHTICTAGESR